MSMMSSPHTHTGHIGNQKRGYSNVPLIQTAKQKNISQAVHGYRRLGFKLNLSEIAMLSGHREQTIHEWKQDIEKCWNASFPDLDTSTDFILGRSFELALTDENSLEDLLGVLLGTYLRLETDLLDEARNLKTVWKIGKHLVKVYRLATCYKKSEDGSPVSAKNPSARYLLESSIKNTMDKFFVRTKGYQKWQSSKSWMPTSILNDHMKTCIEIFLSHIFKYLSLYPISPPPHMFPKTTTQNNTNMHVITIYNSILREFEMNSIFHILMSTTKITRQGLHVAIEHDASTNELDGRSYNVFTRIRSKERLALGYISYDMSAALQSISLHLIQGTKDDYPILWKYTHDDVFKKNYRQTIAQDLGIDPKEVKATLNAFPNGKVTEINDHKLYKAFSLESDRLRREVLRYAFLHDRDVLDRAIAQSKRSDDLPDNIDWTDISSKEPVKEKLAKSSVFFFVWTWYERQIRQAMLTVLPDGIEVHDALYSKMDIPEATVQDTIRMKTGFDILITKEMPDTKKDCLEECKMVVMDGSSSQRFQSSRMSNLSLLQHRIGQCVYQAHSLL